MNYNFLTEGFISFIKENPQPFFIQISMPHPPIPFFIIFIMHMLNISFCSLCLYTIFLLFLIFEFLFSLSGNLLGIILIH